MTRFIFFVCDQNSIWGKQIHISLLDQILQKNLVTQTVDPEPNMLLTLIALGT